MKTMDLIRLETLEAGTRPEPGPVTGRDVLLRVESVGVCGSDLHYYTTGRIGSQIVAFPFVLGHEFSAIVLEVGPEVTRVHPGDRVAVDPAMPCDVCDQCLAGRPHTCRKLLFLGCPGQRDGCLCERIVMPEACCFPVRPGTTADQAALVEPLSIAVYAVRLAGIRPGEKVGILGAGPIGLCVLATVRHAGGAACYVTEPLAGRRAAAEQMGADWTGEPGAPAIKEISGREPLLLDAVFECSGDPAALDDGVRLLRPGGRLLLIGIPEVERVSFEIETLRRRELTLQNVRRQNGCVQTALDRIERGEVDLRPMQTHVFSFDRTPDAFREAVDHKDCVIKAMIHVS